MKTITTDSNIFDSCKCLNDCYNIINNISVIDINIKRHVSCNSCLLNTKFGYLCCYKKINNKFEKYFGSCINKEIIFILK